MTQLGESVTVGMIDDNESPCPFDHTEPEPPAVDNDLIGIGSTLARRMKGGKSTLLYEPMVRKVEEVLDPRHREGHEFKDKARVVKVPIAVRSPKKGQPDTVLHAYPVTCAAHHCIPAQESLKHSKLLAYMVKKGSTEKLKDGKQFTIKDNNGNLISYNSNYGQPTAYQLPLYMRFGWRLTF